ncbi:uroporphyrinogen-III C-methyltransferase [Halomonas denitrificans]|nr:uroporphyrinogen-III C-methyltransferase [Halomonas denitrificans]
MSERKSSETDPDATGPSASGTDPEPGDEATETTRTGGKDEAGVASEGSAGSASEDASRKPAPSRRGGGRGIAVLALLAAIAALVLATRPYWGEGSDGRSANALSADDVRQLDRQLADRLEQRLADRIDPLQSGLDELDALAARVDALAERLDAMDGSIAESVERSIQQSMGEGASQVEALTRRVGRLEGTQSSAEASLEARMAALEQRIEQRVEGLQQRLGTLGDDLEQAGRESARRLALVHARALLLQGRDRLELDGDVDAARAAWSRAAERLREVGAVAGAPAPAADALDRLVEAARALEATDTAGRVQRLDALAAAVDAWPAVRPAGTTAGANERPDSAERDDEAGWRERVGSAFGRLVRVERLDDAAPNPAEVDRARERIRAALAAAAVAAARSDHDTATVLIERAAADLRAYLDTEARVVRQALEQLDELAREPDEPGVPDAFDAAAAAVEAGLETTRPESTR